MIKDLVDDLPKHKRRRYHKRYLDSIEFIALHHTGGGGNPLSFAKYHVNKGWPGIGYHYVIDRKGDVYQTNRIDTVSYNVGGNNRKVIGIAIVGNYEVETLSEVQKDSIADLVLLLRTILGYKRVRAHKDFKSTLCPGKNIAEFIKTLNRDE